MFLFVVFLTFIQINNTWIKIFFNVFEWDKAFVSVEYYSILETIATLLLRNSMSTVISFLGIFNFWKSSCSSSTKASESLWRESGSIMVFSVFWVELILYDYSWKFSYTSMLMKWFCYWKTNKYFIMKFWINLFFFIQDDLKRVWYIWYIFYPRKGFCISAWFICKYC